MPLTLKFAVNKTGIMEKTAQHPKSLIAFFDTHDESEQAVAKLHENGYDMESLSIIALNLCAVENVKGYYTVFDRMKKWGETGALYGGFWGLLFGAATFFIPGIGPILIAGPVAAIVVALEGAAIAGGVSALGAALISIGIPEKHVLKYETEIKAGKYMLLAQGTKEQIGHAQELLGIHIPKEFSNVTDWELSRNRAAAIQHKEPESFNLDNL